MANHKSAAKRARQTVRKEAVNTKRENTVKTFEKKLRKAVETKDITAVPELLKSYVSQLAKAAKTGIFKKETASRKISRISSYVQKALK
ncbi:MAG TPA: 30S ribosomal protein S20 [Pseudobdellovibrionaceae bacterium]|nr:30S ribosomal protein S20 [Pseudobdellovibrionaceae bacterium]